MPLFFLTQTVLPALVVRDAATYLPRRLFAGSAASCQYSIETPPFQTEEGG